jgi:hypothetical protein
MGKATQLEMGKAVGTVEVATVAAAVVAAAMLSILMRILEAALLSIPLCRVEAPAMASRDGGYFEACVLHVKLNALTVMIRYAVTAAVMSLLPRALSVSAVQSLCIAGVCLAWLGKYHITTHLHARRSVSMRLLPVLRHMPL